MRVSRPSKELVIVLTKDEKRTFYGFLGLYLGSSLTLIIIIGFLFYSSQIHQYRELSFSKMQMHAHIITNTIIQSQMQNTPIDIENLAPNNAYMYGIYNSKKEPIYTQIKDKIDFSKKSYLNENNAFYIDDGALGHMGIFYVVVKELQLDGKITQLLHTIIMTILIMYVAIALIGYYLAKLFISPILKQREKLNNFIKDTTHELNTPLSALLLCVDSKDYSSEKNRNHIRLSVKKISNLYKDLIYLFLKTDEEERLKSNDISKILEKELGYFKELAEKKKITIAHTLEPTFLTIQEEDFIRLISNLISNAIKYTKRGGGITISLENNVLVVSDTGIGIEKDKIDKIFKRFYRATENVGGFGIGLSIVHSVCQKYNIKVTVTSVIKKGTTFTLKL
jgi:two-component system OmpR family sensor kinase